MSEKVALVTGGIGGIGTEVCKRLASQGRQVVAGYLPSQEQAALEYGFIDREELRMFLVACLQASVSIEAMSRYLGLDQDTVRKELRLGIEAWNAGRRHAIETIAGPHLRIAASRD